MNHVERTLGETLHGNKGFDFGPGNDRLTDQVKEYVLYCFSIALSQNKGNVLGLQRTIRLFLTPSKITNCAEIGVDKTKTQNLSAIKTYVVVSGGYSKGLVGSDLQTFLTKTLERYACDDIAQKKLL